jgi:translation initiation factor 2B subunit (eIF-2B alpha/beta/delta family)
MVRVRRQPQKRIRNIVMQQQTQSVKEHLKAFRDQIEASREKTDDQVKASLKSAEGHLEEARKNMEAQMKTDRSLDDTQRQKVIDHFKTVSTNTSAALKEDGANLRKRIRTIIDGTDEILTKDY